jgi:RimJ/RimL family protein N-acetyltransferase
MFESSLINLAPIDYEKDAEIESRWTHDLDFVRRLGARPARPLSLAQVKKRYEKIEKEMEEKKSGYYFTIRLRDDDRMVGFAQILLIDWSHGSGSMMIGIGDPHDRNQSYGTQAMRLLLNLAFNELNFHRLGASILEDNPDGLRFLKKFGFVEEVRRRQAVLRQGKRLDVIHLGLLQAEWRPS